MRTRGPRRGPRAETPFTWPTSRLSRDAEPPSVAVRPVVAALSFPRPDTSRMVGRASVRSPYGSTSHKSAESVAVIPRGNCQSLSMVLCVRQRGLCRSGPPGAAGRLRPAAFQGPGGGSRERADLEVLAHSRGAGYLEPVAEPAERDSGRQLPVADQLVQHGQHVDGAGRHVAVGGLPVRQGSAHAQVPRVHRDSVAAAELDALSCPDPAAGGPALASSRSGS